MTTFKRFTPPAEDTDTMVGDPDFVPSKSESDSEPRTFMSIGPPRAEEDAVAARNPPASFALSNALTN